MSVEQRNQPGISGTEALSEAMAQTTQSFLRTMYQPGAGPVLEGAELGVRSLIPAELGGSHRHGVPTSVIVGQQDRNEYDELSNSETPERKPRPSSKGVWQISGVGPSRWQAE